MDQQQPQPMPPIASPPPSMPEAPVVQGTPVVTQGGGSTKSKIIIVAVLLAVLLIALIAGGVYYYLNMQQTVAPAPAPAQITPPTTQLTPTKSPTPEEELNALNVTDSGTDFAAVDKDLQNL